MNYSSLEREKFYKAVEKVCALFGRCRGVCDYCQSAKSIAPKEYEAMRVVEEAEATKRENELTSTLLSQLSDFEVLLYDKSRFLGEENKKLVRDKIVDILCSGVFKEKINLKSKKS